MEAHTIEAESIELQEIRTAKLKHSQCPSAEGLLGNAPYSTSNPPSAGSAGLQATDERKVWRSGKLSVRFPFD